MSLWQHYDMEITVTEASDRLGCTPQHTRSLLRRGLLRGRMFGPLWMVEVESIDEYMKTPHPPGNPAFGPGFWTGRTRGKRKK